MEIIEIAGYTHREKRHIMDKYLIPDAIKNAGLATYIDNFELPPHVRDHILHNYAREPGVRSVKKFVNRIMEKVAYKITEHDQIPQDKIIVD